MSMFRTFRIFIAVALLLVVAGPAHADEPQRSMKEIFNAVVELLPIAVSESGFADEATREEARAALASLVDATGTLGDHAELRDADFLQRTRSLAEDAERAQLAFELDRFQEVRISVYAITQDCIGCHARLPDPVDSALADRWLDHSRLATLAAPERARLYVATRRFDDALALFESVFADPEVAPYEADVSGWLAEYLTVALRVKRDPARARRALEALSARPDAPRYLSARAEGWARDLRELESADLVAKPALARARAMGEHARSWDEIPFMRDGLVFDMMASGLLLEWLDHPGPDAPPSDVAEAWYRLAVLDERVASITAMPRSEFYLEAAIRAESGGPLAPRSYERLQEIVLVDYGAPTVDALPRRERERLTELEQLIDWGPPDDAEGAQ